VCVAFIGLAPGPTVFSVVAAEERNTPGALKKNATWPAPPTGRPGPRRRPEAGGPACGPPRKASGDHGGPTHTSGWGLAEAALLFASGRAATDSGVLAETQARGTVPADHPGAGFFSRGATGSKSVGTGRCCLPVVVGGCRWISGWGSAGGIGHGDPRWIVAEALGNPDRQHPRRSHPPDYTVDPLGDPERAGPNPPRARREPGFWNTKWGRRICGQPRPGAPRVAKTRRRWTMTASTLPQMAGVRRNWPARCWRRRTALIVVDAGDFGFLRGAGYRKLRAVRGLDQCGPFGWPWFRVTATGSVAAQIGGRTP